MKIRQSRNSKKSFILMLSIAVLIGLASLLAAYYYKVGVFSPKVVNGINYNEPSEEEKSTGDAIKKQSLENTQNDKSPTGSDPTLAPQPIEGSDKKTVNMEITSTNQAETTLHIRTLIQTLTKSGTCNLSMAGPHNSTYTAEVGVQPLSNSTTCKGFDLPLSDLASGKWSVTINFSNEEIVTSATKEIEIN